MRIPGASAPARLTVCLLVATLVLLAGAAVAGGLAVGDRAPAFALPGSDGRTHTLEDLLASHRGAVLAWFPKAFTPG